MQALTSSASATTVRFRTTASTPFVHLCYDHDSPFKIKGPKYFAELLYLAVDFKKSNDSDESLSVEEIDCEIQRLKRTLFDD